MKGAGPDSGPLLGDMTGDSVYREAPGSGATPSCRVAKAKRRVRGRHGVARVYIALVGGLTPRYQSTVARNPLGNEVCAFQPKASKARDVSSLRRGWPSGWDGSK